MVIMNQSFNNSSYSFSEYVKVLEYRWVC